MLSAYERETIITYNQEESTVDCFTYDLVLQRKLDRLVSKSEAIRMVRQGDGWREYTFPKKWLSVRFPKQYTEEQRKAMAERMRNWRNHNGMA